MRILASYVFVTLLISACAPKKVESPLHYTLTGTGDTTLVFVHGWAIDGDYWKSQVEYFSPTYTVLTLDLQGHGQSPARNETMTIDKYADDVVQLLTELDLKNIVLIGHSMSGNVNLHVYDKLSDRIVGFIGIDNFQVVGHIPGEDEKKQAADYLSLMRNNYDSAAKEFGKMLFAPETDQKVKDRVMGDVLELDPDYSVSTLEGLLNEGTVERSILPKMKVPLLIVMAKGSMPTDSAHVALCGSGYKKWEYTQAGHYPMIEIPDTFNMQLAEAIRYRN